jgi:hypothetical protein
MLVQDLARKRKSTTLQIVFTDRKAELLTQLCEMKGLSQSDIFNELISRCLEKCEKLENHGEIKNESK